MATLQVHKRVGRIIKLESNSVPVTRPVRVERSVGIVHFVQVEIPRSADMPPTGHQPKTGWGAWVADVLASRKRAHTIGNHEIALDIAHRHEVKIPRLR